MTFSCIRTRALLIGLTALMVSACGSNTPATNEIDNDQTSITLDIGQAALAYSQSGPYPVGVTTVELEAGNKVEVWYPAIDGTSGTESYDVRDFVPDAIRQLLVADVPATYEYAARRDATVADGEFPLVLFSHGASGIRLQSTFLTSHLASWGMIVAAPDHWSRDLFHTLSAPVGDRASAVTELLGTLDLVTSENARPDSVLHSHVRLSDVVAVGHSAGGRTVVDAAKDERIDAYISLASSVLGFGSTDSSTTSIPLDVPSKPSFFLAGALDQVVPAESATRASFATVPGPSRLWILDGVGHNGFDDFCTFGNGTGIIGVAIASGLGPLLEAQPNLKRLGEDGCLPPAVPVSVGFPVIRHAVTAQIRAWFGIDKQPVGLGPDVASKYELAVTIDVKD